MTHPHALNISDLSASPTKSFFSCNIIYKEHEHPTSTIETWALWCRCKAMMSQPFNRHVTFRKTCHLCDTGDPKCFVRCQAWPLRQWEKPCSNLAFFSLQDDGAGARGGVGYVWYRFGTWRFCLKSIHPHCCLAAWCFLTLRFRGWEGTKRTGRILVGMYGDANRIFKAKYIR